MPTMAVRPIVAYPDPVLLKPCREVTEITKEILDLIPDMVDTMYAAPGIGLAANQIGVDLRIAVIDLSVGKDPNGLHVWINPVIVSSEGRDSDEEGCLSVPDFLEKVQRPHRVRVEALNQDGKKIEIEAEGLFAKAACHEVDHLNGLLFINRLSPLKRNLIKKKIRKRMRDGDWSGPSE
jgi:peptide deformylase